MEKPIKEIVVGNQKLKIFYDTMAGSPREWDNLAKMIFTGKHQHFGDEHDMKFDGGYLNRQDFIQKGEKEVRKHFKDVVLCKAVHLYDHSGIAISTKFEYPFNDVWDSGTIGFAIVTKADLLKEYDSKRVTKKMLESAEQVLVGEVEVLSEYIEGNVFRYELVEVSKCEKGCEHEEHKDSCGGFYGNDFKDNGIADGLDNELKEVLLNEA